MTRHRNSTYVKLLERIEAKGKGTILFNQDFYDLNSDEIRYTLSRMVTDGILIRLSNGIYLYPKYNQFGAEYPSTDELVEAIARRDSARIIPFGMTAANILGLSEQVPMKNIYLTDGAARKINIRDRIIELRRTVPASFAYCTKIMPILIQAMKAIKEENLTDEHRAQINTILSKEEDKLSLLKDIQRAPQWIRKYLTQNYYELVGTDRK